MARPAHVTPDDVVLRERAHAPVETALRAHFLSLGGTVDDAALRDATSIVLRGLTPTMLARIAASGIAGTDLIQALIPRPAASGAPPPFNWSSITPAEIARLRALGLLSEHHHRQALAEAREETAAGPANSSRFDGIYTGSDWSSPAGQRAMQAHAHRHGIPWAASHPDILRLGPSAIETLARTRFRHETYRSLREAGFEARDAVSIAHFAERTGQDANRVGQDIANSIRIFGNGNPDQERLWREMLRNYYTNPEDAGARERLTTALTTQQVTGTPEQQAHALRMQEIVRLAEQARVEAEAARVREAERLRAAEAERARIEADRVREAAEQARLTAQRQAEEAAAREARLAGPTNAADDVFGAAPPAVVVRTRTDGAPPAATPPPQPAAQASAAPGGA